jgi:homoserine kinase
MESTNNLREVCVFAPASTANVNCGFDVMGFSLDEPGDRIVARKTNSKEIKITKITGDRSLLPNSTEKNTAGIAALSLLKRLNYEGGIELEVHKEMPMGSGLGSSAASAVGAVVAVNRLLDSPLSPIELLPFAAEGEKITSGTAHYDNVAPSMIGGFVLIRSQNPLDIIKLDCPVPLFATVVHPHIEIQTKDTRKLLRREVSLRKAVIQWGNVGGLVAGILKGDYELISNSLCDVIIEPIRSLLIPGFEDVKTAAGEAGALGSGISGSGPSVFALSSTEEAAQKAGAEMKKTFSELGLDNDVYISEIKQGGPHILKEKKDS